MKTSRATVEHNRERLLQVASEGFRSRGFDGLRVADLMRECGLTHGGFGTYFASKDDLAEQACDLTLRRQIDKLSPADGFDLKRYVTLYLSAKNRDEPDQACLFPSLATEIPRQGQGVRRVFTQGLRDYLDRLDGLTAGQGVAVLSALVGAMVLARAVDDPDLSDDILARAAEGLVG